MWNSSLECQNIGAMWIFVSGLASLFQLATADHGIIPFPYFNYSSSSKPLFLTSTYIYYYVAIFEMSFPTWGANYVQFYTWLLFRCTARLSGYSH